MSKVNVQIKVSHIHCGNTEDHTGADELYITSVLSDGTPAQTQASIIGPMSINDDQHRYPNQIVFNATVEDTAVIRGGFVAFDEDTSKDWSEKPKWVEQLKDGVVSKLKSSPNSYAVAAGTILEWGYKILDKLMSSDQDDKLGEHLVSISATGPDHETLPRWHFWEDGDVIGYSSWNYSVHIEVTRIREPLYSAVWRPGNQGEHQAYSVPFNTFKATYDQLWPQNWRLHTLQSHVHNGQVLYNAVWRPGSAGEHQVYGWPYYSFKAKYDELWPQNWRLHILQSYVHNGQVLYNAVWRPGNSGEHQVYGWPYHSFKVKYDELWIQNWRLHILQSYVHNGQVLYNAVWRPGNSGEIQVYGWPHDSFRAKYDQLWPQNWRLHILQSYVHNGQVLYNAVWRPGNSGEYQTYGWSYASLKAKYDELWTQNWRLHTLVAY